MTAKDTDELMHLLQDTKTTAQLQTYTNTLAEQTILQTFPEYLNSKMIERNISPAELIAAAQIQRNYGYQILNGTRKPSLPSALRLVLICRKRNGHSRSRNSDSFIRRTKETPYSYFPSTKNSLCCR